MASEIIASAPDCEIVSSGIVSASTEIVFTAWSDPSHLKNWWIRQDSQILLLSLTFAPVAMEFYHAREMS